MDILILKYGAKVRKKAESAKFYAYKMERGKWKVERGKWKEERGKWKEGCGRSGYGLCAQAFVPLALIAVEDVEVDLGCDARNTSVG